nr:ubiquitin like fold super family autophagy-related protein 8e [Sicyoidochytrium minutum DNA virus]
MLGVNKHETLKMERDSEYDSTSNIEIRRQKVHDLMERYPGRVPVIVELDAGVIKAGYEMKYPKLLVFPYTTLSSFMCQVRSRIVSTSSRFGSGLRSDEAIYLFFDNQLYPITEEIGEIYKKHKADDEILYVSVCFQSSFGGAVYSMGGEPCCADKEDGLEHSPDYYREAQSGGTIFPPSVRRRQIGRHRRIRVNDVPGLYQIPEEEAIPDLMTAEEFFAVNPDYRPSTPIQVQ